jgi:biotin carboxyl carrier protein
MARDVISRTKKGWVGAGAVLQAGRIKISDGRWHRYGLLAVMLVCGGLLIRVGHDFFAPIQIAEARLQIPSQPVTTPTDLVVARERGRVGALFVREGAAVAPGQDLFSLKRDPNVEQDLVDRGLARDLSDLNVQIRDAQREINSLAERQVLVRPMASPQFERQLSLAEQRLARRRLLMEQGGLSRDRVQETEERLLRLQRDAAEWREDQNKLKSLQDLMQQQRSRLAQLRERQSSLQAVDQTRRAELRVHPPLNLTTQRHLDYSSYRASSRGTVLRLFKEPGDPVRPHEAIALIQNELPPPVVEATVPRSQHWLMNPDQQARVEIPSLRQRYEAQYLAVQRHSDTHQRIRLRLIGVPAEEIRRLLALPGEPVRLWIPREHRLVRWMRTRDLSAWATS